jgi:TolB-like protein
MRMRSMIALPLVAGMVFSVAAVAQDTRPGVGILSFENGGSYGQEAEDFQALEVGLQQMLIGDMAGNSGMRLVERGRLQELLQEQDLGAAGRVDANTAAQIGRLIGARYMIMGSFVDWYGDFRLDARVVDVETSEIIKTDRARGSREELFDILGELADNIPSGLELPALSARDRQVRQENRERLGQANPDAVRAYMRGLLYQDRGDNERAAELFSQAIAAFPEYHEAREALNQVSE